MDTNIWTEFGYVGVFGLFAFLIIKELFVFLKGRKPMPTSALAVESADRRVACKECHALVVKLYDMHNVKDKDGTPIWYVKHTLEDAIKELAGNINHQTEVFKELVYLLKDRK